jgi:hypothetical protein
LPSLNLLLLNLGFPCGCRARLCLQQVNYSGKGIMQTLRALLSAAVLLASSVYAEESSVGPALRGSILSIDLNTTAVSVEQIRGDKLSMGFYAEGGE